MTKYTFAVFAAVLLIVFAISCGTRDDRNDIRAQYGEPDAMRRTGADPFWSETWYYNSLGVAFEFRRTAGCGSNRDVYLYLSYYYTPIPRDSTGATSVKPNKKSNAQEHVDHSLWPVAPR